jgi:hypothetical protein
MAQSSIRLIADTDVSRTTRVLGVDSHSEQYHHDSKLFSLVVVMVVGGISTAHNASNTSAC